MEEGVGVEQTVEHLDDVVPAGWRPKWSRVVLALVAVALFVVVRQTGVADTLTDETRLQDFVDDAGWWAAVVYTVAFTVFVPVGVPGLVFVLPAAVVFPAPVAIAICLVAGYVSSGAGMWFARTIGRTSVERRMPARFRAWDEQLAARGLIAVIVLRLLTYLAAPADWVLGLSSIRTRTLVIGTGIGLVPPTLLYVLAGGGLLEIVL